ncbi:hypothetical protein [Deinococcus misasensis]|uniref:hypothetical protein n=1 Tax=Deinococcus misasensis TaxID=392413 RepID=UPI0005577147|nr:hypothetical protein [Deinococcus misasensis]
MPLKAPQSLHPSDPTPEPEAPAARAPQATPDPEPTPEPEPLPENFPALDLLQTAGFTTRQQVQQADDATLLAIEGLGKATLAKIRSYPTGG